MKFLVEFFAVLLTALLVGGCASNSSSEGTGQFVDDPVAGLTYECSSGTAGVTDANGWYTCAVGDNVTFSIGNVLIGTVTAESGIVTPYDFFPADQESAINLARLLQSVDTDSSDDIITLDTALVALLDASTDFTSPTFEADVEADLGITLVSAEDAQTQLNETIVSLGEEVPDGANIPVADAGVDQNVHNGDVVTLDGSQSSDADGDSLSYAWSITSKPGTSSATLSSATVVNPTFTADVSGVYTVQLIVNDGSVNSAPDEVLVTATATAENSVPIADAGVDQNVNTTDIVNLNGSGSTDADVTDVLTYSWTMTSKPTLSVATLSSATVIDPTFTADLDGIYEVELIVNDGTVDSAPDRVVITASSVNSAPVADAGADQEVTTNDTVTLSGSASTDANLDTLTYLWNMTSKPDGSSATLSSTTVVNPTFIADIAGSYVISLVVNDGTVDSDNTDSVTVSATDSTTPVYGTVTSPGTGKIWHDRNLGATQVCTSYNDTACYGDYYQWGRDADGHQVLTSATTATQATDVTTVGHSDFITSASSPYDWGFVADQNGAIRKANWSSTTGNSVCPVGFRLPTKIELNNERIMQNIYDNYSAYNSFLKLPSAGGRYADSGDIYGQGSLGYLWSSDVEDLGTGFYVYSPSMYYDSTSADVTNDVARGGGIAVRCIKN